MQDRDFLAVDQDGTGSALRQPAAELRADQLEIVAQHVEQRSVVGRLHLAPDTIHIERDHRELLLLHCNCSTTATSNFE